MNWAPPPPGHPLAPLQTGPWAVLLGPPSRYGALYFRLLRQREGPQARAGRASEEALTGLYSRGPYPAYNWIEVVRYNATEGPWEEGLFRSLGALIPPGGHLMAEYESPRWRATAQALGLGVPPAATELGLLLLAAGCGAAFKDWYFAEGGAEGPRKLQGFKPLTEEQARAGARRQREELEAFLAGAPAEAYRAGALRALVLLERVLAE